MPRITIDGKDIEAPNGSTILQAARMAGIEIPTMCYEEGHKAQTSCMMCVVKVNGNPNLACSCARLAEEGMVVESNEDDDVREVRKTTMDLILSDHIGDCVAPCSIACPAHMEIPQMLRFAAEGENLKALVTVKRDIPFPSILGRLCPELCEGSCRRGTYDTFESICLVKRYVADAELERTGAVWIPECAPDNGHQVAVVGSGPAGMSAAYYLRELGYRVVMFEAAPELGGAMRYHVKEEELPRSVLDAELDGLKQMGVEFRTGTPIGEDVTIETLREDYDAVFLGVGRVDEAMWERFGVDCRRGKPVINANTMATSISGVFSGGGMLRDRNLSIWALANGKTAAMSIHQHVTGETIKGREKRFNSRSGKLDCGEVTTMLEPQVNREDRYEAEGTGTKFSKADAKGFTDLEAAKESARCLHCDCRAKDCCDLRDYSELYEAKQTRFAGTRRAVAPLTLHGTVHLDTGKCLQCGLCVQIAKDGGEPIGLAYDGRGFQTAIVAPLGYSLDDALTHTAEAAARACPTGALAIREEEGTTQNPFDLFKPITL